MDRWSAHVKVSKGKCLNDELFDYRQSHTANGIHVIDREREKSQHKKSACYVDHALLGLPGWSCSRCMGQPLQGTDGMNVMLPSPHHAAGPVIMRPWKMLGKCVLRCTCTQVPFGRPVVGYKSGCKVAQRMSQKS